MVSVFGHHGTEVKGKVFSGTCAIFHCISLFYTDLLFNPPSSVVSKNPSHHASDLRSESQFVHFQLTGNNAGLDFTCKRPIFNRKGLSEEAKKADGSTTKNMDSLQQERPFGSVETNIS